MASNNNHQALHFYTILVILLSLVISSFSVSSSSSQEHQKQPPSASAAPPPSNLAVLVPTQYQVLYIKHTIPFLLTAKEDEIMMTNNEIKKKHLHYFSSRRRRRRQHSLDVNNIKNSKKRKMKMKSGHRYQRAVKNSRSARAFSVMLPKGFVPPSGSSSCHNDNPVSSITFSCDLSTAKP